MGGDDRTWGISMPRRVPIVRPPKHSEVSWSSSTPPTPLPSTLEVKQQVPGIALRLSIVEPNRRLFPSTMPTETTRGDISSSSHRRGSPYCGPVHQRPSHTNWHITRWDASARMAWKMLPQSNGTDSPRPDPISVVSSARDDDQSSLTLIHPSPPPHCRTCPVRPCSDKTTSLPPISGISSRPPFVSRQGTIVIDTIRTNAHMPSNDPGPCDV